MEVAARRARSCSNYNAVYNLHAASENPIRLARSRFSLLRPFEYLIAIAVIGIEGVYFLTTIGFIVAMLTNLRLPAGNPQPRADQRSPLNDLMDGLGYIRRRPSISLLILTSFLVVMIGFPYQSFLASISVEVYDVGPRGFGTLSTVSAIGAVVATIVVASYAGHRRAWFAQN